MLKYRIYYTRVKLSTEENPHSDMCAVRTICVMSIEDYLSQHIFEWFFYILLVVLSLLENILASDTATSNSETAVEVTRQAVCCAGSWLQLGVPLPDCEKLADHLVASVFTSTASQQLHQIG